MTSLRCDVAIIGGGTAGLAAERSARRNGAATLLIDDGFRGTTCATVGCMPSKLLIAAGRAAHAARQAGQFGIFLPKIAVDGPVVMLRVRALRDEFVAGTCKSIAELPAGVPVTGRAKFIAPDELQLDDGRTVSAKAIIIATGSRPSIPPMFEALGDLALTNESIFEIEDLPASVAVIGAGPLGLELAQALSRLGVDTMVFDEGDKVGGLKDPQLSAELRDLLQRELPIKLGVKIAAKRQDRIVDLTWSGSEGGNRQFERVLVATGRPPQLAGLDLAKTGLTLDERGTPVFDPATMQCGDAGIFMAGDADASRPILHEASSDGAIAGRNAASFPVVHPTERAVPLSIMFTDPPLAVIGVTDGKDQVVGCASFETQGRAKVDAANRGSVRLYAEPADGRLVGAVMMAPGSENMAHLMAWAIERKETATTLLDLPFYHPTLEEGLKPALRMICDAVHAPAPSDRDDAGPPGA